MSQKIDHRKQKEYSRKGSRTRNVKQTFLIITEGVNTEPDYFNAFRLTSATIKTLGQGKSTTTLVKKAINIKANLKKLGRTFDQYWIAFDKDDNSDKDCNDAIKLAQKSGFHVAYSNQAFEYWFVLHYKQYEGRYSRARLCSMLSKLIGFEYSKKSGATSYLFDILYPKQQRAIENAKNVQKKISLGNPAREESSTTVYELVEELNRFL